MEPIKAVIIATSFKRTSLLLDRCLPSIFSQSAVDPEKIRIIIIDDNTGNAEYNQIVNGVKQLRTQKGIPEKSFPTSVIKNQRTSGNSGTGAWNTGIYFVHKENPDGYVSILDDDDEYLPNHLADCIRCLKPNITAVFQSLYWQNEDGSRIEFPLEEEYITPVHFFIGNPGVQGSNMFFKAITLVSIGGFDESLPSATDRDLMIRFLWFMQNRNKSSPDPNKFIVLRKPGVIYHNHSGQKVNSDTEKKQKGLELFYVKFREHFDDEAYQQSLLRAKRFFKYGETGK